MLQTLDWLLACFIGSYKAKTAAVLFPEGRSGDPCGSALASSSWGVGHGVTVLENRVVCVV